MLPTYRTTPTRKKPHRRRSRYQDDDERRGREHPPLLDRCIVVVVVVVDVIVPPVDGAIHDIVTFLVVAAVRDATVRDIPRGSIDVRSRELRVRSDVYEVR